MSESSAAAVPLSPAPADRRPDAGQVGLLTFLGSEVAFFSTLIVAYIVFYGRDSQPGGMGGPIPLKALSLGLALVTTSCLLASSLTVHLADRALKRSRNGLFLFFWAATIALGSAFLLGTAYEWSNLILHEGLTISRNLFGTTFYTLVGFHALHVTIGVIVMLIILFLAMRVRLEERQREGVQLVSWYWHFVDGVWIVVFTVVYLMPHLS
jgi:cytochrome c oxidase subunit 3/cytochrome o ubiquinol oxidase subunit 3